MIIGLEDNNFFLQGLTSVSCIDLCLWSHQTPPRLCTEPLVLLEVSRPGYDTRLSFLFSCRCNILPRPLGVMIRFLGEMTAILGSETCEARHVKSQRTYPILQSILENNLLYFHFKCSKYSLSPLLKPLMKEDGYVPHSLPGRVIKSQQFLYEGPEA